MTTNNKTSILTGLTVTVLAVTVLSLVMFSQNLSVSAIASQQLDVKDTDELKQQLSVSKAKIQQEMDRLDRSYLPIFVTWIDHDKNELVVGIDENSPLPIETYRERVRVIIGNTPAMIEFGKYVPDVCSSRTTQCSPVYGGIRVEIDSGYSTLAFADTDDSGRKGIVVAGHATSGWGNTGDDVGQDTSSRIIADVVTNPSGPTRFCDCAFAEIRKDAWEGYLYTTDETDIYKSSSVSYNIIGKKASHQTSVNDDVNTSGISTGLQSGQITDLDIDVTTSEGYLENQVVADYYSQPGDSGKPVFSDDTTNVYLYGMHHGRVMVGQQSMAVYSPWESIQSELDLTS